MQTKNVMIHKKFKKIKWLFEKNIEIPEDWNLKKITDIGEINGGGTPDTTNIDYWGGNVLWAVPTDITKLKNNKIDNTKKKITREGLANSSAKLLPSNTILITTRATIGKCAITTKIMSTNQGFQNITCNNNHNNLFIFYLIEFNNNTLLRLSYGTTFLEISKKEFKKILLPMPSLLEQQKIASILSKVDALIESTQECVEKIQKLKKGLMQILLTKGINHKKFKNVNLNGSFIKLKVAEKWTIMPLENFIKIDSGDYFPYAEIASKGMPILKIDNVMYGKIDWTNKTYLNKKYLQTKDVILLNKNDIVLALNRPITNDNVKVAKLTNKDIPCILYQRVGKIVLYDTNKICSDFFYTYLSSSIFKLILNRILIGTDQPYVKTTELLRQKILIPQYN